VENDVLLECKIVNGFQHDALVRLPCGDDRAPDRQGLHPELLQRLDKSRRRRLGERSLLLLCGIEQQAAVLGHHEIEQPDWIEDISEIGKISPGHKDELASRVPQLLESSACCIINSPVPRQRPVIIGGKGNKEHETSRAGRTDANWFQPANAGVSSANENARGQRWLVFVRRMQKLSTSALIWGVGGMAPHRSKCG